MDFREAKIGFIGFGSMAAAICDGLLIKKVVDPSSVYACARDMDKLHARCDERGINACGSAGEVAAASDIVVIAVLPQQVESVVKASADALKGKPLFSIAAGIDYERYVSYLGEGFNHISTVPNTPIAIGEGIIVAEAKHSLTPDQLELFEGVFSQIAKIEYFSSELLSLGGTGAGCAPAFVDVFIEAMADAAVLGGMPRAQAYKFAAQAVLGSAKMMLDTGKHPGELKDMVCSPAGTTIEAVRVLEERGFRSAVIEGTVACIEKSAEMNASKN